MIKQLKEKIEIQYLTSRVRRPTVSSDKITNEQVKYAIQLLKQNQQITMFELVKLTTKGNLR